MVGAEGGEALADEFGSGVCDAGVAGGLELAFGKSEARESNGVEVNVNGEGNGPGSRVDNDGFEAALKKVSNSLVAAIEPGGVAEVEPLNGA